MTARQTAEQRIVIQQYGDWYTGSGCVGCYIWYSEEGPGLLAVANVTAHTPTAYYSIWQYNCLCTLKG